MLIFASKLLLTRLQCIYSFFDIFSLIFCQKLTLKTTKTLIEICLKYMCYKKYGWLWFNNGVDVGADIDIGVESSAAELIFHIIIVPLLCCQFLKRKNIFYHCGLPVITYFRLWMHLRILISDIILFIGCVVDKWEFELG